jgi:membrane protein implicated in regulation of membrane protease activity
MGIDIRIPIGLMFAILGAMLAVYGALSNPAIYVRSLGANVNTWWGLVLLLFGSVMLVLGWRGHRASTSAASNHPPAGAADRSH